MIILFLSRTKYLLIFCLSIVFLNIDCAFLKNPFKSQVIINEITTCRDVKQSDVIIPTVRKYNRTTQILNFNLSLGDGYNDKQMFDLEIKKWSGGWKNNFFHFTAGKACSNTLKLLGDLLTAMMKAGGIEPKCPIPKGNYTLNNVVVDFTKIPLVTMDGQYKLRLKMLKDKVNTGVCVDVVTTVKKE